MTQISRMAFGQLDLTASAFNQLDQYTSNPVMAAY